MPESANSRLPTLELEGYSHEDIMRRLEVTYRWLDYWARKGPGKATLIPAQGSGTPRRWSEEDFQFLRRLRAVELEYTSKVEELCRERGYGPPLLRSGRPVWPESQSLNTRLFRSEEGK